MGQGNGKINYSWYTKWHLRLNILIFVIPIIIIEMISIIILSFLIFHILLLKDPALSSGEIAGIVICVLIAVILLSVLILYLLDHVGIIDFRKKMDDGKKLLGFSNETYEQNMASSPGFNSVKFFKENCEDRPEPPPTVATWPKWLTICRRHLQLHLYDFFFVFWIKFYRSLLHGDQLTISRHWFT